MDRQFDTYKMIQIEKSDYVLITLASYLCSTNAIIQNTGIVLQKMISLLGRTMEIAQIIFYRNNSEHKSRRNENNN